MDLHDLHDRVGRHVLQQAGVVDARIDARRRGAVGVAERGVGDLLLYGGRLAGHELARGVAHDADEVIVAGREDAEARRLLAVLAGERGNERDAHLLAFAQARFGKDVARRFDHAARLPVVGAGAGQDLAQVVVVADLDDLRLAAFEVGERVLGVLRRFGEHGGVGGRRVGAIGAERIGSVIARRGWYRPRRRRGSSRPRSRRPWPARRAERPPHHRAPARPRRAGCRPAAR